MPKGNQSGAHDRRLDELKEAIHKCSTLCKTVQDEYDSAPLTIQDLVCTCQGLNIALEVVKCLVEHHVDEYTPPKGIGRKLDDCFEFVKRYRSLKQDYIKSTKKLRNAIQVSWQKKWQSDQFAPDAQIAEDLNKSLSFDVRTLANFIFVFALKRNIPVNSIPQSSRRGITSSSKSMPASAQTMIIELGLVHDIYDKAINLAAAKREAPNFGDLESIWHTLCVRVGLAEQEGPTPPFPREPLLEGPFATTTTLPMRVTRKPVAPSLENSPPSPRPSTSPASNVPGSSTANTTPSPLPRPQSKKTVASSIKLPEAARPTYTASIFLPIQGEYREIRLQSWVVRPVGDLHVIEWTGADPTEKLEHYLPPQVFPATLHKSHGEELCISFYEEHRLVLKKEDGPPYGFTFTPEHSYKFLSPGPRKDFQEDVRRKNLVKTFDFEYLWSKRASRENEGEAILQDLKIWQDRQDPYPHSISFFSTKEGQNLEIPVSLLKAKARRDEKHKRYVYIDFIRRKESLPGTGTAPATGPAAVPRRQSTLERVSTKFSKPFSKDKTSTTPKRNSFSSDSSGNASPDISEILKFLAIEFARSKEADDFVETFESLHNEGGDGTHLPSPQEQPMEQSLMHATPSVTGSNGHFVGRLNSKDSYQSTTSTLAGSSQRTPLTQASSSQFANFSESPRSPVFVNSPTILTAEPSPNLDHSLQQFPDASPRERAIRSKVQKNQRSFSGSNSVADVVGLVMTSAQENKYSYTDLSDPNEIRLLLIHPAKDISAPIYCEIVSSKNEAEPRKPYEALSYTWGTNAQVKEIHVFSPTMAEPKAGQKKSIPLGDKCWAKLYIGTNLHAAIRHLRHHTEKIVLWIDALCIDQANIPEKNQQVTMMAEIYNRATNVCIWLGEEDEHSKLALDYIPELLRGNLHLFLKDESKASSWYALAELMRNRWFSRRWIVQEVVLAKRPTLHCGQNSVHWGDFADAVGLFVKHFDTIDALVRNSQQFKNTADPLGNVRTGAYVLVDAMSGLFSRLEDGYIERLSSLENLVSTLLSFESTEPRDTIYALLSLANDTAEGNPSNSFYQDEPPLVPDYKKPLLDVLKEFIDFAVKTSDSLDIICRNWAPVVKQKGLLPSWTPSVKRSAYGTPVDRLSGRINGDSFVGTPERKSYNATPQTRPVWRFGEIQDPNLDPFVDQTSNNNALGIFNSGSPSGSSHPDVKGKSPLRDSPGRDASVPKQIARCDGSMFVKGFRLDIIERISTRVAGGIIPRECLELGGYEIPDQDDDDEVPAVPEKLWRTMVGNRGPDGNHPPAIYKRACEKCLAKSREGDINIEKLIQHDDDPETVDFLKRVQSIILNRKFILSARYEPRKKMGVTKLFGLAPWQAEQGDIICMLLGCSVPVILREHNTDRHYFELIGEAYIYGMMKGEALGGRRLDQLELDQLEEESEWFELR